MNRLLLVPLLLLILDGRAAAQDALPVDRLVGDHWYSLRMQGKRVGWRRWTIARTETALVMRDQATYEMDVGGEKTKSSTDETWSYALAAPHGLIALDTRSEEPGEVATIRARLEGGVFKVVQTHGKDEVALERTPPRETFRDVMRAELAVLAGEAVGSRFEIDAFLSEKLEDEKAVVEYLKVDPAPATGKDRTHHFRMTMQDRTRLELELDDQAVIRVLRAGTLEMVLATEAEAKTLDAGFDGLRDLAIAIPYLGPSSHIERLTIAVTGLKADELPVTARQRVAPLPDGRLSLALVRLPYRTPDSPEALDPEARRRALADEPKLAIAHPKIRELAARITAGVDGDWARAQAINRWLFSSLGKTYKSDASSALAVVANATGDCSEHALLFVALARAIGLPAREVSGLVYLGSAEESLFGWHAWVEVWIGCWHEMDPSWGEDAVNATHVRLAATPEEEGVMSNLQGRFSFAHGQTGERGTDTIELREGTSLVGTVKLYDGSHLEVSTACALLRIPRAEVATIAFAEPAPPRYEAGGVVLVAPAAEWTVATAAPFAWAAEGVLANVASPDGEITGLLVASTTAHDLSAHADALQASLFPGSTVLNTRRGSIGATACEDRLLRLVDTERIAVMRVAVAGGRGYAVAARCPAASLDRRQKALAALIESLVVPGG